VGLHPKPYWGSLQHFSSPQLEFRGSTSKGREGRKREKMGRGREKMRERKRREGEEK